MEFVTSRRFQLPDSAQEMEERFWFNMWQTQQWPFRELTIGDSLYWYESPAQRLVWNTRVSSIERFTYSTKFEAAQTLRTRFTDLDTEQSYFAEAPERGYCLAWKVTSLERLDLPKPAGFRFPMLGWLRLDDEIASQWRLFQITDETTLDDLAPQSVLLEQLRHLNERMNRITPERIGSIVGLTLRRDTQMVRTLKASCEYRCQFPGCGVRIPKRDGGYYAEVAHIQAVADGGRSILGNLLVLCPNHHKEFDHGLLVIDDQAIDYLRGSLNGKPFEIRMAGLP